MSSSVHKNTFRGDCGPEPLSDISSIIRHFLHYPAFPRVILLGVVSLLKERRFYHSPHSLPKISRDRSGHSKNTLSDRIVTSVRESCPVGTTLFRDPDPRSELTTERNGRPLALVRPTPMARFSESKDSAVILVLVRLDEMSARLSRSGSKRRKNRMNRHLNLHIWTVLGSVQKSPRGALCLTNVLCPQQPSSIVFSHRALCDRFCSSRTGYKEAPAKTPPQKYSNPFSPKEPR